MTQGGQPGSLLDLLGPWSATSFHLSHGPCTREQDPMPSAPTGASAACGCSQEGPFSFPVAFYPHTDGWLDRLRPQAPRMHSPKAPPHLGPDGSPCLPLLLDSDALLLQSFLIGHL